jgi:DNA-binding SARP family transcriptional activator/tetratricopeptide (TPR) repeat protein
MTDLDIKLLGEPQLLFCGAPWALRAPRTTWSVIALLVMHPHPIARAALSSILWPDRESAGARSALRRFLYILTTTLPPSAQWIVSDAKSLGWNHSAPCRIDVLEFERAIAEHRLSDAIELYAGDLLGSTFDEAILEHRERLRTMYLNALATLTKQTYAERNFAAAIRYAELLLSADPWREDAIRALMIARFQSGDRSGALLVYDRFARALDHELRTQPMDETTSLRAAILSGAVVHDDAPISADGSVPFMTNVATGWKSPLVGRAEDFERLRSAWSRAARKSGGVIFVSGEAGIGKSRLLGELVALVRDQGGQALIGNTSNPEGAPYQSIVGALRGALTYMTSEQVEEPWLAKLSSVLPEIHGIAPALEEFDPSGDRGAREQLLDGFANVIAHLALKRPLCLVLEDLHWAGNATIDLLGRLARRVGTLPVLIVATYRAQESAAEMVQELRATLVRERRAHAMTLERLAPSDIALVVRSVIKDTAALDAVEDSVARLSEGNPLFVVQLLEGYRETGILPDASIALHTIGEAIANRTHRLSENTRALAEAAATIGETFAVDVVAAMNGWDENTVLDAIGELMDRALVRESGGGVLEYAFTHALVAESFYQGSDPKLRAARHRRAAQIMSRAQNQDRAKPQTIARHWQLAGDKKRASEAWGLAARATIEIHAHEETVAYAHEAARLASDDAMRFRALTSAAKAFIEMGDAVRGIAEMKNLEVVAERLGDKERLEALQLRTQFATRIGDFEAEQQCVERMFSVANTSGSEDWLIEAFFARGSQEARCDELGKAIDSLREALNRAIACDADARLAAIRQKLIQTLMARSDYAAARIELDAQRLFLSKRGRLVRNFRVLLAEEAELAWLIEDGVLLEKLAMQTMELAREAGDEHHVGLAYALLARAASLQQDLGSARNHSDLSLELFARSADGRSSIVAQLDRSIIELLVGRAEESLRWLEKVLQTVETEFIPKVIQCVVQINRAEALLIAGPPEDALRAATTAYDLSLDIAERRFVFEALTALGAAELQHGATDDAMEHLKDAIERMHGRWDRQGARTPLCRFVEASVSSGRAAEASDAAAELTSLFSDDRLSSSRSTQLCWALARYAEATGRPDERAEWLARGAGLLRTTLGKLKDPADVKAYSSLPHNRGLLEATKERRSPRFS